jgi:hypothetical protein
MYQISESDTYAFSLVSEEKSRPSEASKKNSQVLKFKKQKIIDGSSRTDRNT